MDAIQAAGSAVDLVRNMVAAVQALQRASRDMRDAPQKVENLEAVLNQLTELQMEARDSFRNRLHHPRLGVQLKSLDSLLQKVRPQVKSARKTASRKGAKFVVTVMWSSVFGDRLTQITNSMLLQLNSWLEMQKLTSDVRRTIYTTAKDLPSLPRVQSDLNYPLSDRVQSIREMLDSPDEHTRVIVLHGLSGIGKSCLARQVAVLSTKRFSDGAVELVLGQWCSRAACAGNYGEYHKRLAVKLGRLLRQMGRKKEDLEGANLEDVCYMLQETLESKSLIILLDDVWEPDIIDRFVKLYDNKCKYIATTRNEAVHEITGVKVEIGKDDTRHLSKSILLFHSQLSEFEIPKEAETLIQRCGHHPLTLAVMGKALRGETRPEQWKKAIENLWTYAAQAPVPVPYLNEKEAENAATVFGSFEFSLEGMAPYARDLFTALAALCWVEPIPEACLEAVWYALSQDSTFLLISGQLIERSLLSKTSVGVLYEVHDMVSLYLESKASEALMMLLVKAEPVKCVSVAPWLFTFGKSQTQNAAEEVIKRALYSNQGSLAGLTLSTIVDVLSASKSISELEATSVNFNRFVGPELPALLLMDSEDLTAAIVCFLASCFTVNDYMQYSQCMESAGLIDKLINLVKTHSDVVVQTDAGMVLTRLMDVGDLGIGKKVLNKMPVKALVELLDPAVEETQHNIMNAILSLAKAGKGDTVYQIFMAGMDRKLSALLGGTEVTQNRAVAALKQFHELGGSTIVSKFLTSAGNLRRLPWQTRLVLERLIKLEGSPSMPAPYLVGQLLGRLIDGSGKEQGEAMQELIPIIDKAGNPDVREMILQSNIVEHLAKYLQDDESDSRLRSEAAFALMKLGCSGGVVCISHILKAGVVETLVSMICKSHKGLQGTAYSALHNLIGAGKLLITDQILKSRQLEKVVSLLQYTTSDSREIGVYCIQDLVEFGGKACIERLLALQVFEKLAVMAQNSNRFKDVVINFVKGIEKCQGLSGAEHRVFRQQLKRKMKASVKDFNQITAITAILQGSCEPSR